MRAGRDVIGSCSRDRRRRTHRLTVTDGPFDRCQTTVARGVRVLPGQEHVKQHPELIDVGSRRHRLPANLLGTSVVGRQESHRAPGSFVDLRGQELRDAEIEQLGDALCGDQDIRRLDVAMDDQAAMSRFDGPPHRHEETKTGCYVVAAFDTEAVDGQAGHILHDEVGPAVLQDPTVEKPGDIRMFETGKDAPFHQKTPQQLLGFEAALDDLEGHPLVEGPVRPLGEVHDSHATATELSHDPVRTDHGSRRELAIGLQTFEIREESGVGRTPGHQERVVLLRIRQQLFDGSPQRWILSAFAIEKRASGVLG